MKNILHEHTVRVVTRLLMPGSARSAIASKSARRHRDVHLEDRPGDFGRRRTRALIDLGRHHKDNDFDNGVVLPYNTYLNANSRQSNIWRRLEEPPLLAPDEAEVVVGTYRDPDGCLDERCGPPGLHNSIHRALFSHLFAMGRYAQEGSSTSHAHGAELDRGLIRSSLVISVACTKGEAPATELRRSLRKRLVCLWRAIVTPASMELRLLSHLPSYSFSGVPSTSQLESSMSVSKWTLPLQRLCIYTI